jgi:hypothetical protein
MRDACSKKVSKNQKIVCAQVTQTKTGLSAVRTFNPLGVKIPSKCIAKLSKILATFDVCYNTITITYSSMLKYIFVYIEIVLQPLYSALLCLVTILFVKVIIAPHYSTKISLQ